MAEDEPLGPTVPNALNHRRVVASIRVDITPWQTDEVSFNLSQPRQTIRLDEENPTSVSLKSLYLAAFWPEWRVWNHWPQSKRRRPGQHPSGVAGPTPSPEPRGSYWCLICSWCLLLLRHASPGHRWGQQGGNEKVVKQANPLGGWSLPQSWSLILKGSLQLLLGGKSCGSTSTTKIKDALAAKYMSGMNGRISIGFRFWVFKTKQHPWKDVQLKASGIKYE